MRRKILPVSRDLWFPVFVGLVGCLLSLSVWGILIMERRAQVLQTTTDAAAEIGRVVEQQLAQQLATLEDLAETWSDFGLGPLPEWTAEADRLVGQGHGLRAVAWVDPGAARSRIALGRGGSPEAIHLDLEEAGRQRRGAHMAGPRRDASGSLSFSVFLPVGEPGGRAGVLVGYFQVEPLLDGLLEARAPGYALLVRWQEQEIFSRGTPATDRWQRWWRVEQVAALPLGQRWRVVLRPTPELAAAELEPVPHYLLAAGIALSAVLGILAHQLRVIMRQSRFLSATNRALEERSLELESKVAERTEELEAFNYSVSHDLRSPLGAILNFAAILEEDYRDKPLDAEGIGLLDRIRRSASRATHLLEDLLELSAAGRSALALEPVDMTRLAREAFVQTRVDDGDGVVVDFRVDPLPEATGDRSLLHEVFTNLFSNALKYSRGREKPSIRVSGWIENGECVYEVSDNGSGFDMRFADKIFGLFERLDAVNEVEGTGVGLAIVARIVKRHGGRVDANARAGEGARFTFTIPRREAP